LRLPPGIIAVLDRARRHCLWRKKDKHRVNSLAAWDMICKPKNKGGLGIINLQIQNSALLLKHLHKFYNHEDIPWVHLVRDAYYYQSVPHAVVLSGSFWWRSVISLSEEYRSITSVTIGNGSSTLFWSDLWKEEAFDSKFLRLYSFAKDRLQSVKEFALKDSILDNFDLPLSVEAHAELSSLMDLIGDAHLNESVHDSWIFKLGGVGYRPSKVYKYAFNHLETNQPACWIWKSKCNSKHKFFAWLVLQDRINTKDMILRRHWHVIDNHNCILCHEITLEDWRHLFFNYTFSTRIWNYLQISWIPGSHLASILAAKKSFLGPCFIEIVILACWCIWKQRNGWIFKNIRPTFRGWKSSFVYEITLLRHRVKDCTASDLVSWLDRLP
jgi:hypothetical protein